jgi:hypothetical protein
MAQTSVLRWLLMPISLPAAENIAVLYTLHPAAVGIEALAAQELMK